MNLSGVDSVLLKALYNAPDMSGEVIKLLEGKGIKVTLKQAHKIGERLNEFGYIIYNGTRAYTDATLAMGGINHVRGV